MNHDLSRHRPALAKFLTDFLTAHQAEWQTQRWGADIIGRLKEFSVTGKLVRGSLVLQAYELFSQKNSDSVLPLAAAVECMQSALLIHDDIIDQDQLRRGEPSIPVQYSSLAHEKGYLNSTHAGTSLALCVGDISFFLSFELLSQLSSSAEIYSKLIKNFALEYQLVGLGEMDDAHLAFTTESVSVDEILAVYRSKTARYTLVMPVLLAGILAEADAALLKKLEKITENLGLIFQIKDDQLGIFGTEAQIGKPVTSDVREGKKTLYYYYGMKLAHGQSRQILKQSFGNPNLSLEDLEQVKTQLQESGAVTAVDDYLQTLETNVKTQIKNLNHPEWQTFLQHFLDFNLLRKH